MEVKNGIIIDGILHELKNSKAKNCKGCSLKELCEEEFFGSCVCWICTDSPSVNGSAIFYNRGKVKIEIKNNNRNKQRI